jgi:dinuclear metal center YbgI/SA1388 family protein
MPTVNHVCEFLERFAPPRLAEDWDNVGLLVGRRNAEIARVMTCLTVTPDSAAEAVAERAGLIVTHHPLPFHALKRVTSDTTPGRLLLDLIAAQVAVFSPHTAFDSAAAGINQQLAEGLGLTEIVPLVETAGDPDALGSGRRGRLAAPVTLGELAARLGRFLSLPGMQLVGRPDDSIERVAVACGSAGQFLEAARRCGCQLLVTGETSFHTCLEAEATGVALLLPGHFASERFAVEQLAGVLAREFPQLAVWASRRETDPLRWIAPSP